MILPTWFISIKTYVVLPKVLYLFHLYHWSGTSDLIWISHLIQILCHTNLQSCVIPVYPIKVHWYQSYLSFQAPINLIHIYWIPYRSTHIWWLIPLLHHTISSPCRYPWDVLHPHLIQPNRKILVNIFFHKFYLLRNIHIIPPLNSVLKTFDVYVISNFPNMCLFENHLLLDIWMIP